VIPCTSLRKIGGADDLARSKTGVVVAGVVVVVSTVGRAGSIGVTAHV
jgi:hypothetical protein